jgi:hypothetical protein
MRMLRFFGAPWRRAGEEILAAMQAVLDRPGRQALSISVMMFLSLLSWFVYVPVHELLHAFGCMATGGSVSRLEIAPLYGGAVLAHLFPFVTAGGGYAGRLSGFDTRGSDLIYLATDFAPFLVTIAGASVLLRMARRRAGTLWLGLGTVLYVGPAISVIGDYYEMGSIIVSRLLAIALGAQVGARAMQLRHDDVVVFVQGFAERFAQNQAGWAIAAAASFLVGLVLVTLTLGASQLFADRAMGTENTGGRRGACQ